MLEAEIERELDAVEHFLFKGASANFKASWNAAREAVQEREGVEMD